MASILVSIGGSAVLKRFDQWNVSVLHGALIALLVAVFGWFFRDRLIEASFFFALSVVSAVLVYRVVSQSERAFNVMLWALFLTFLTLTSLEESLAVPAAGPWFLGFIVGSIAGGYVWHGPRAGTEFKQPNRRQADGSFSGGRRLAAINAVCALALLGIGTAQLFLLSPTVAVVSVLAAAVLAGWVLFRFPPPLQVRNGLILIVPVVWFALAFVGGATDQMALPHAWGYGIVAGILIGGRYWSGPRMGEPRPPFSGPGKRRRRRRRPRSKQQTQKHEQPVAGTFMSSRTKTVEAVREEIMTAIAEVRSVAQAEQDESRQTTANWFDARFADVTDTRGLRVAAADGLSLYGGNGSFSDVGTAESHHAVSNLAVALRRGPSWFLRNS